MATASPRILRQNRNGADLWILENRFIRVTVWPEHGAAILGFESLEHQLDVIWKNPLLQPPRRSLLAQPVTGGSDLYDVLDGSWFTSLPTGWFPAKYFGAPIGAHGEFRSLSFEAEVLEESPERVRIKVVGKSIRTPFLLERVWELAKDSKVLAWEEALTNRSTKDRPCAWLQHTLFGGALLDGAELRLPARTIATYDFDRPVGTQIKQGYRGNWPHIPETGGGMRDCSRIPPPGSGIDHSVQMTNLSVGWGCLWNHAMRHGFALRWDEQLFPWAWSWLHTGGSNEQPVGEDYPFWGGGHLISLQPGTSPLAPFPELVDSGQVVTVPAGGALRTRFLTGFTDQPDEPWPLSSKSESLIDG